MQEASDVKQSIFLDCAQDQQHEIGRNLEALVKPGEGNPPETRTLTDDDEYDPEQGSIEF